MEVYVVIVRYTTGDSFGITHGAWCVEGVYAEKDEANKVYKSILDNTYEGYKEWEGYFEHLESAQVETFKIK